MTHKILFALLRRTYDKVAGAKEHIDWLEQNQHQATPLADSDPPPDPPPPGPPNT